MDEKAWKPASSTPKEWLAIAAFLSVVLLLVSFAMLPPASGRRRWRSTVARPDAN